MPSAATSVMEETGTRSSLSKALSLLVVVAERSTPGITLSSAANRAGLHVATAHSLMAALVDENFLNFDPYTKRSCLGLMPYEIVTRKAVHAAVQLRDGMQADPEDIVRFVKTRLGSVKAPKSVVIYDRLPRNNYGKLQKQTLVDDYVARAEQGGSRP